MLICITPGNFGWFSSSTSMFNLHHSNRVLGIGIISMKCFSVVCVVERHMSCIYYVKQCTGSYFDKTMSSPASHHLVCDLDTLLVNRHHWTLQMQLNFSQNTLWSRWILLAGTVVLYDTNLLSAKIWSTSSINLFQHQINNPQMHRPGGEKNSQKRQGHRLVDGTSFLLEFVCYFGQLEWVCCRDHLQHQSSSLFLTQQIMEAKTVSHCFIDWLIKATKITRCIIQIYTMQLYASDSGAF